MSPASPRTKTIKRLFALSGNQCAFADCQNLLVDTGIILGEICHIEASSPGGPRPNLNMSDEERHGYENLILLCRRHHKLVDAKENETTYPAELLHSIKRAHETKHALDSNNIFEKMSEQFAIQLHDNHLNDNSSINTTINQIGTLNFVQNSDELKSTKKRIRDLLSDINPVLVKLVDNNSPSNAGYGRQLKTPKTCQTCERAFGFQKLSAV